MAILLLFSSTGVVFAETEGTDISKKRTSNENEPVDLYLPGAVPLGSAILSAADPSYCLNAENGSVKSGTNAQLYKYDRTYGCSFTLSRVGEGDSKIVDGAMYEIILTKSNKSQTGLKCLSVGDGNICNARNVVLKKRNCSKEQYWILKKNSDGTVTFLSSLNRNYALDLRSCKTVNKQNIQVYRANGTKAQKWKIKKLERTDLGDYRTDYAKKMETYTQKKGSRKRYNLMPVDPLPYEFRYSSSNPSVAAVDSSGVVTAKGKGTAIITVRADDYNGITAKLRICVP